jgi:hypothetical protein
MAQPRSLVEVLQQRIDKFDGAKSLALYTLDGAELLSGIYKFSYHFQLFQKMISNKQYKAIMQCQLVKK